jgi:hypothetical protein
MTHPIIDLQTSIIGKLNADAPLVALIGANAIFDMPPKGKTAPYLAIIRHDLIVRDTDLTPGNDHRLQLRLWSPDPSRAKVLDAGERVIAVLISEMLSTVTLKVTTVRHQRTDTAIDLKTGRAYATMAFRILSEPAI